MYMPNKTKWYLSKTLWLSVIMALSGVLAIVQEFLVAGDMSAVGLTSLVIGILNFINRFFTTTSLE
jgi:membrane-bound ClpP family serine protease